MKHMIYQGIHKPGFREAIERILAVQVK